MRREDRDEDRDEEDKRKERRRRRLWTMAGQPRSQAAAREDREADHDDDTAEDEGEERAAPPAWAQRAQHRETVFSTRFSGVAAIAHGAKPGSSPAPMSWAGELRTTEAQRRHC